MYDGKRREKQCPTYREMSRFDVVLTTYNVLKDEVNYRSVGAGGGLANKTRVIFHWDWAWRTKHLFYITVCVIFMVQTTF